MQIKHYVLNMHDYLPRKLEAEIGQFLDVFPAVAILGPRQSGKSTLARHLMDQIPQSVYLDLETDADRRKLRDPDLFFDHHRGRLICLDEIQLMPDLFRPLRSILDRGARNGQIVILGSASRDLIRQSSETLAGRIGYLELTPFVADEVAPSWDLQKRLWLRGGFPRSFLANDDTSSQIWRTSFVRTYLERDIPQLGFSIPASVLGRLWRMCAHVHGSVLNISKLAASLGISQPTVRRYLDLMNQTFMIRQLPAFSANLKKRLVKSPKLFVRDAGILHSLLGIDTMDDLMAHPVFASSWEGFCMENILSACGQMSASYYRTTNGAELDLVLDRGQKRLAIEFKATTAPALTRGFWNALRDVQPDHAWVVAPVSEAYPIGENVMVVPVLEVMSHFAGESLE